MAEPRIALRWIVRESHAKELAESVEVAGGHVGGTEPWTPGPKLLDEYGDSQFEPFMIAGVVVATGWLIKRVSDVALDWKRPGGVVVDASGHEVVVREAPRAPRGAVILVDEQGARVVLDAKEDPALAPLGDLLRHAGG